MVTKGEQTGCRWSCGFSLNKVIAAAKPKQFYRCKLASKFILRLKLQEHALHFCLIATSLEAFLLFWGQPPLHRCPSVLFAQLTCRLP